MMVSLRLKVVEQEDLTPPMRAVVHPTVLLALEQYTKCLQPVACRLVQQRDDGEGPAGRLEVQVQVKAESSAPCAVLTVRSDSGVAEDTVYISSAACSYYSYFDRYRHDAGELPEGGGGGGSVSSVMELELETAPDFAATPIAKRVRLVVSSRSPIAEGVVTSEIAAAQLQCALSGTVVDVGSESPSAVLVRLLGHNVTLYVLGVDFDEVAAAPGLPCSAPLYARIEKGSTALAVVLKHSVPITSLPQQSPRTSRPIADALASTAEGTSKFYTAWWQDAFQSMSAILHRGGSTAAGSQATPTQMVLVTGPAGAGKKSLLHNFAVRTSLTVVTVAAAVVQVELESTANDGGGETGGTKSFGGSKSLKAAVSKAVALAPSLLLIDGLDSFSPAGGGGSNGSGVGCSVVCSALLRMSANRSGADDTAGDGGGSSNHAVFIAGTACDRTSVPLPLLSTGLFSREVVVQSPTLQDRQGILTAMLQHHFGIAEPRRDGKDGSSSSSSSSSSSRVGTEDVDGSGGGGGGGGGSGGGDDVSAIMNHMHVAAKLAKRTAGYLPKDLARLCWTAWARDAADRAINSTACISTEEGAGGRGNAAASALDWSTCWLPALAETKTSVPGPFETGIEQVGWADVAGYGKLRARLTRLLDSVQQGTSLEGVEPPAGVVLHGPTGCGKTLLASAALSNCTVNVIRVQATELFGKYVGESEERIRALFAAARRCKPCIVFLDELDAVALKRGSEQAGTTGVEERVLSQLLNEIDGIQDSRGVFVLGCTNQPLTELDDAILRPGRFEIHLEMTRPSQQDRQDIAALWCNRMFGCGNGYGHGKGRRAELATMIADLGRWVGVEAVGATGAEVGWLFQQAAIDLVGFKQGDGGSGYEAAFVAAVRNAMARFKGCPE